MPKWVYEARPPHIAVAVYGSPLDMASGAATLPFPQNRPPHFHLAVKGFFFECLQYNS